jgi:hypothetical protein
MVWIAHTPPRSGQDGEDTADDGDDPMSPLRKRGRDDGDAEATTTVDGDRGPASAKKAKTSPEPLEAPVLRELADEVDAHWNVVGDPVTEIIKPHKPKTLSFGLL